MFPAARSISAMQAHTGTSRTTPIRLDSVCIGEARGFLMTAAAHQFDVVEDGGLIGGGHSSSISSIHASTSAARIAHFASKRVTASLAHLWSSVFVSMSLFGYGRNLKVILKVPRF